MGGHTRVHGDEEAARVDERDLPPLELEARQALNQGVRGCDRVQEGVGGHTRVHGDEEAARVDERDLPPLELEALQVARQRVLCKG